MTASDEGAGSPVRTGQGPTSLSRNEFVRRFHERFADPAFESSDAAIGQLADSAWHLYRTRRKSTRERLAGTEFADPSQPLPVEWLETRLRIQEAQRDFEEPTNPSRILLICASPRTDETCPSEMSKTFRLVNEARQCIAQHPNFIVDQLDLSVLTAEYGKVIHPCKACVSTAMPLCHWPCSCYPNYYLGQSPDWMNELYPRWVAAHGVMIVTPVHWYQAPSVMKLMMDRLVCADGGNPDPTTTSGKDAAKAKSIEIKGWHYPKHLKGRVFSIVVHGDAAGAETLRRGLHDWLVDMALISAGAPAVLDRYIGYLEPYATSHNALDRDAAVLLEVRNAALTLVGATLEMRRGRIAPGHELEEPRPK